MRTFRILKLMVSYFKGDSGGPAFQLVNGRYYQFGIASSISITIPFDNKCYKSNPVHYTKTSLYIDWIEESIYTNINSKEEYIKTKC